MAFLLVCLLPFFRSLDFLSSRSGKGLNIHSWLSPFEHMLPRVLRPLLHRPRPSLSQRLIPIRFASEEQAEEDDENPGRLLLCFDDL